MDESELLDMISKENSWEEVIEYIVAEEGMDPWNIDIVKLAEAFSSYLAKIKDLDFSVPARLIIIAAVLIRMKVEVLLWEEKENKEEKSPDEVKIDMSQIPDLQTPLRRMPQRRVTLEELVGALERAFSTREKRGVREHRALERVESVVNIDEQFDISAKIDELYSRISMVLDEMRSGELKFSSLVTEWTRKDVVESLLPLLHLNTEGKVSLEQEEPFKEIFIKLRKEMKDDKESDA